MIRETFEVINALGTICLFIATYFYLLDYPSAENTVCFLTVSTVLFGYTTYYWLNRDRTPAREVMNDAGGFFFLTFILTFLTPMLHSLTITYSEDTVALLVVCLSLSHLWTYDYETPSNLPVTPRQTEHGKNSR